MQVRLIINADDFGLTPGVNRAIAELHDAGALTSATLMANGPAFDDAVALALARPTLGVGCHIVLVDGTPVSDPATIPTLLGPDRRTFRNSLGDFALGVLRGAIRQDDIQREALAQIQKLQRAGLKLTHVDTHKHTHLSRASHAPSSARSSNPASAPSAIPSSPAGPHHSAAARAAASSSAPSAPAAAALRHRRPSPPTASSQLAAPSASPQPVTSTAPPSAALLKSIPDGTWELVCHPGYNDADLDAITTRLRTERETELRALLAAFAKSSSPSMNPSGLQLIHYGELTSLAISDPS